MKEKKNNKEKKNGMVIGRRDLFKMGLFMGLGGLLPGCKNSGSTVSNPVWSGPLNPDIKNINYKVSGWFGNNYEIAHKFRDGFSPPEPEPDEKKELVVIGAGLSGLIASYKLRDRDLLILETEKEFGGNAKSLEWEGKPFNIGSAYFVDTSGDYGALWEELKINPQEVHSPADTWIMGSEFVEEPWAEETIKILKKPELQKKMAAFREALVEIVDGDDFPTTPCEDSSEKSLELDRITFAEWAKPYLTEELKGFLDAYCYSAMGTSSDVVSAFGGINFYSEVVGTICTKSDGNSHIAKALYKGIEEAGANRLRNSAYVYRVKQNINGTVTVYYFMNDEARAVEAKKVIISAPYFVAGKIIDGLSPGQAYALGFPEYGSYMTVNLRFNKVVSFNSYDTWIPAGQIFTDFIPIGWQEKNPNLAKTGECQIITCFAPYMQPVMGRCHMMMEEKEKIAESVVMTFEKLCPGSREHLEEVYLTRWGHAIIINQTHMFTKWLPRVEKKIGSIYLAHSDGQCLPAVETAVSEALWAARELS